MVIDAKAGVTSRGQDLRAGDPLESSDSRATKEIRKVAGWKRRIATPRGIRRAFSIGPNRICGHRRRSTLRNLYKCSPYLFSTFYFVEISSLIPRKPLSANILPSLRYFLQVSCFLCAGFMILLNCFLRRLWFLFGLLDFGTCNYLSVRFQIKDNNTEGFLHAILNRIYKECNIKEGNIKNLI